MTEQERRSWFRETGRPGGADVSTLARALWMRRRDLGLTREEAARRAAISSHYWWELERGAKQGSPRTLGRVALALGLKPHELLASADALEDGGHYAEAHTPGREGDGLERSRRLADRLGEVLEGAAPVEAEVALLIALGKARSGAVLQAARSTEPGGSTPAGSPPILDRTEPSSDATSAPVARSRIDRSNLRSIVGAIPPGRWATYGDVASALGLPGAALAVASRIGRDPGIESGHRVLRADGHISPRWRAHDGRAGPEVCAERLRAEGVDVTDERADPGRRLPREELAALGR